MKIKKITEDKLNLDSLFYFLNELPLSKSPKESIEFIKQLNLTQDQYSKLAEIMEDYARERYYDGRQDGVSSMQDPY